MPLTLDQTWELERLGMDANDERRRRGCRCSGFASAPFRGNPDGHGKASV